MPHLLKIVDEPIKAIVELNPKTVPKFVASSIVAMIGLRGKILRTWFQME
jgi:hypothetical protein